MGAGAMRGVCRVKKDALDVRGGLGFGRGGIEPLAAAQKICGVASCQRSAHSTSSSEREGKFCPRAAQTRCRAAGKPERSFRATGGHDTEPAAAHEGQYPSSGRLALRDQEQLLPAFSKGAKWCNGLAANDIRARILSLRVFPPIGNRQSGAGTSARCGECSVPMQAGPQNAEESHKVRAKRSRV